MRVVFNLAFLAETDSRKSVTANALLIPFAAMGKRNASNYIIARSKKQLKRINKNINEKIFPVKYSSLFRFII